MAHRTVTQLLHEVQKGESEAPEKLFALVYEELHRLAHQQRRGWQGDYTMNTTALVHEAYLKLVDQTDPTWNSRAHFLSVAAKAMRHILINYAEQRRAQKRGGGLARVPLDEIQDVLAGTLSMSKDHAEALLGLEDALSRLEQISERQSRIVECRFFGGMTIDDTAEALNLSSASVKRGWTMAQAWLYRAMREEEEAE